MVYCPKQGDTVIDSFLGIAWENVIIGLLGGFIVSVVFFLTRRIKEWLLQRKYPVAGEYISKYEDVINGQRMMVAAPATLKQRGHHIEGSTIMDGREWSLSGELSNTGYIHGVYSAADPLDQGVGNFFLRVSLDHHLDGLCRATTRRTIRLHRGGTFFGRSTRP
jgi:hypothetical protein